eukprot:XP_015155904.2 uncharacterized protein LOC107055427 [Gallus gallus]
MHLSLLPSFSSMLFFLKPPWDSDSKLCTAGWHETQEQCLAQILFNSTHPRHDLPNKFLKLMVDYHEDRRAIPPDEQKCGYPGSYHHSDGQDMTTLIIEMQEASCSRALVLVGDFNHLDICWKDHTASCKRSRRLVESIDDNFLVQVVDRPTRGEALLDLLLTNAEEIIKDVNVGGSLGCSDHALVEFVISRDVDLAKGGVRTLSFGRANFKLFSELLAKIP